MLPGPVRRLGRERFALFVGVLAVATCVGAGLVSDQARVRIASELDQHWRGAYDILVEPLGDTSAAAATHGLVEADFLGFGGRGGISLSQVDAIREINGVDIAAPVAMVGAVRYVAAYPVLSRSDLPSRPTLYRIDGSLRTTDGLDPTTLASVSGRLLMGPDEEFSTWVTDLGDMSSGGGSGAVAVQALEISIQSPILAVDPVAEAQLLGAGGAFLQPLASLPDRARLDRGSIDATLIPERFAIDRMQFLSSTGPVIPVVVAERIGAALDVSMSVKQLGSPIAASLPPDGSAVARLIAAEDLAGAGETPVGTSHLDLTDVAVPYSITQATIPWPGQTPVDAGIVVRSFNDLDAIVAERPTYTERMGQDGGSALRIEPVAQPGATTAYRTLRKVPLAVKGGGLDPSVDRAFRIAPLGTFDLASILPESDPLTYVPFGAYDPPETTLFADPAGSPVPEVRLKPTTDPAGLVVPPPLVITDIQGAQVLRGPSPIDAVRVRVAGVTGYDADGRARVEEIASRIRSLGLKVTVVAGASPQEVSIYVPGYRRGGGAPADLGWVHQWWTSLGVALRVETGVARTSASLLVLAAFAVSAGLLALALARFDRRRRQVIVLAAMGWTRRRTAAWFGAEAAVVAIAAAILGAAAAVATGASSTAVAVIAVVVAALVGSALLEALLLLWVRPGRASGGRALLPRRAGGPLSLGLRSAVARPIWTVAAIVLATLSAVSIGAVAALLADFASSLGTSRLGAHAASVAGAPEAVLGAVAVAGSLIVLAALLIAGVDARAGDWRTLQALGWRRRSIGLALGAELSVVLLVGVVATAIAAPLAAPVPSLSGLTVAASLAAAPVVVAAGAVVSVLDARRLVRTG